MPRLTAASRELAGRDRVMAGLVAQHGPMVVPTRTRVDRRFEAIAQAIAYQQLAGRAAATIWGRTKALVGDRPFDAPVVLALSDEQLRSAGLSGAKAAAVRDLAWQVDTGSVRLDQVGRMSDADVVAELTKVRGVGPWTAHMFLIFDLHRLDVWPTGDLGVRAGYRLAYGLDDLPDPRELDALGDPFRPYRSLAAWYCWRAVDVRPPSL